MDDATVLAADAQTGCITYRPLTDAERRVARALGRVTFAVGSPDKRFARHIGAQAERLDGRISEAQAGYLRRLVQRYRRQIPNHERLLAEGV